jgi:serine protease Do
VEARGFLGVAHEQTDNGVQVTDVVPGTAAEAAGIKAGDIVRKVDDVTIDNPRRLVEAVGNHKPGDTVSLVIQRGERELKLEAALGTRRLAGARVQRFNMMDQMGSRLSRRRDGFPYVLQHDSVIAPEHCGGPLVDLSGNAIGINIARAGRVASYAVPAETVLALLPELKSGKWAPPEPSTAVSLEQVEARLRRAVAEEAKTSDRAESLREEIERLQSERNELLGRGGGR